MARRPNKPGRSLRRPASPRTAAEWLGALSGWEDIDRLYGLEPVFEPGTDAGSDALERFVEIECPYCAQAMTARIDLSAGAQSYVEDCQVCCQPITLSLRLTEEGQLREVTAERLEQ